MQMHFSNLFDDSNQMIFLSKLQGKIQQRRKFTSKTSLFSTTTIRSENCHDQFSRSFHEHCQNLFGKFNVLLCKNPIYGN